MVRANVPTNNWLDDRYFHGVGQESAAGVRVSPEAARRANAVYCCVGIRAETIASYPLLVYKRLPNGDKELASQHPNYRLLHEQPNSWQTSFEWREMMEAHLDLRGNAYSEKIPGPMGPMDQLVPLHPDRVTPVRYTDGSIEYQVRRLNGQLEILQPEQILHLRGWSEDGVRGVSPIMAQMDTIGIALGAQDYQARFLKNDATPSVVLKHPALLSDEAYTRLKESWQERQTGANRHKAAILEENMSLEKVGMTNKDAQLLEAQAATDHRIAAMYRIPAHMLNLLDRATHSNIEHQGLEFRTGTMFPIAKRWEAILARDLFFPLYDDPGGEYFAEFLLDGISRGDQPSRYTAYSIGRNWGWLSANDVRRMENMNSIGDQGDEYLRPLNMTIEGQPQDVQPNAGTGPDDTADTSDEPDDANGASAHRLRLQVISETAAVRMARKESSGIKRLLAKHKGESHAFVAAVRTFYTGHAKQISELLCVSHVKAIQFCSVNAGCIEAAANLGNWPLVESTIAMNEGRARNLAQLAMEVVQ